MNFMELIWILNALCENDKQILNEIMLESNPLETWQNPYPRWDVIFFAEFPVDSIVTSFHVLNSYIIMK